MRDSGDTLYLGGNRKIITDGPEDCCAVIVRPNGGPKSSERGCCNPVSGRGFDGFMKCSTHLSEEESVEEWGRAVMACQNRADELKRRFAHLGVAVSVRLSGPSGALDAGFVEVDLSEEQAWFVVEALDILNGMTSP